MEALYIHISSKLEAIRFGKPSGGGGGNTLLNIAEIKTPQFWRAVYAEFLAQILFVFLGCISAPNILKLDTTSGFQLIKISLAFGLAIMALIQMIGHVSGGHINPAVTIGMLVAMNISIIRAIFYVSAQVAGAIIGGYIVKGCTPSDFHNNLAVTALGPGVTQGQGFGVELILTFCLVMVIFGTTDPNRPSFGSPALLIGLTVTLGHLAGISYTGSSMNPSRSLGSAVASGSWDNHWIYWVGPICGGIVAALMYKYVINPYHGVTNMDDAINTLNSDENFVAIPKDYFKPADKDIKIIDSSHM